MKNNSIIETKKLTGWQRKVANYASKDAYKVGNRISWDAIYEKIKGEKDLEGLTKIQVKDKIRRWYASNTSEIETSAVKPESKSTSKASKKKAASSEKCRKQAIAAREAIDDEENRIDEMVKNTETRVVERGETKDGSFSRTIEALLAPDAPIDNDEFILKLLGFNPENFKLKNLSVRESNWQAQRKGGEIVTLQAKKFSATVAPYLDDISLATLRKTIYEEMSNIDSPNVPAIKVSADARTLAVFSIADLHFGKLSHGAETGDNFDHKIATDTFNYIVAKAVAGIKAKIKSGQPIEKIIFYWSQDFFHYDNMEGTTTAGTKQDCDIRLPKMYKLGCHLLTSAVKELAKVAPVETFWVRSNHDTVLGFDACLHLQAYFHNDKRVIVDDSEFPRKYRRYGVTELGFAHGDKEGSRIAHCMQNDEEGKKYWSDCYYHEFFLGHYHSEASKDIAGVLCRYLGSPTSADYWTNTSGFVGAQKKSQVFYYDKEEGLTGYDCIMIPKSLNQ